MAKSASILNLMTVLIYLISFIESNKFTILCYRKDKKYYCLGIPSENVETECTGCAEMFGYKDTGYRFTTDSKALTNYDFERNWVQKDQERQHELNFDFTFDAEPNSCVCKPKKNDD